jgi:hypothetical protein
MATVAMHVSNVLPFASSVAYAQGGWMLSQQQIAPMAHGHRTVGRFVSAEVLTKERNN